MSVQTSYYNETSGAAFNAVLDVSFSEEDNVIPVTREEAKTWLRLESVQDNIIVDIIIKAALSICSKYLNHSLISRTVTATLNNSCGNIYLPYGPVTEITSVTDSTDTVLETSQYSVTGTRFVRLVRPMEDNVTVVYKAGHVGLPAEIKLGVLCQIAYMYENRGDETGLKSGISPIAKSHLKPLRMA